MSKIPQHFIDDLLARVDIVDVIDRRVKLKKTGKNYAACCPFHDEKTPSFTVSPDKQFYYCFGCGANGNAIGFIMEYERQGFVESVENLASFAGLEVPREEQQSPEQEKQNLKRKALYRLLEEANNHFQERLKSHPQREPAVHYLKQRGLSGVAAKHFNLGFSPNSWDDLLRTLGKTRDEQTYMVDAGLVIQKEENSKRYDRFRNRIIFPIRDIKGRTIGFGGRVLGNEKPKYLNSPETDVFHKGKELYGLYEARKANSQLEKLLVVEGYMDVIALAQYSISNAVATLGTACGEDHLKLAFRFTSEIIFCFDGDNAGLKAAKRALLNALSSMEDGRQIKFLFLPTGQDPDSLVRQVGTEKFKAMIEQATPLEEFLFEVAAESVDINTMDGRARFSKIAAPLLDQLPEGVYRELMFDNLAKRTGLSTELLRELRSEPIEIGQEPDIKSHGIVATPQIPPPNIPPLNNPPVQTQPADLDSPPYFDEDIPPADHYLQEEATEEAVAEPRYHIPQSNVQLSPARLATILLVDAPGLVDQISIPDDFNANGNQEIERLLRLIEHLKKRPDSSFNKIMGYWAGAYGLSEQQDLAKLAANQCFRSTKGVSTYDQQRELTHAIGKLIDGQIGIQTKNELAELSRKFNTDPSALTEEERKRYLELVSFADKAKKTH